MPRLISFLAFLCCVLLANAAPEPAPSPPATAGEAVPPKASISPSPPAPAVAAPTASDSLPAPEAAKSGPAYSAVEKFDRAVAAYNTGDYSEARNAFLELVKEGHLSAPLAHNLANIEYKSGNLGQASLWYRRALALQPLNAETRQNLRFLQHKLGFHTWDSTQDMMFGLSASHLPGATLRHTTLLAAWGVVILLVWLMWSPPRPGWRWPLVTLLALLLPVGSVSGALWWLKENDAHPLDKRYVLTGADSAAYASPAEASSLLITLHTGSEVMPLESRGNWFYCEIPSQPDTILRGWVRHASLEPLWPYPAKPLE
ncbi:MAG: tetratricopeptide repeat protein [Verrucomicrobiales bacterium]|nr:tetratricopeptide repeat protein [Verrucomicrobiales bacterium]